MVGPTLGNVEEGKFMDIVEVNECLKAEVRHVKKVEAVRKAARKAFLGLTILLTVVLYYLYFSSPGWVVVNRNGEIHGLVNQAREALQGKKFWKDQLHEVRQEIRWEEFGIMRKAANDRILEKISRDTNREMEKFYRRYPQAKFSQAERRTEARTKPFDQIKYMKFHPFLEEMRQKRFQELRMILPVVQSRAE